MREVCYDEEVGTVSLSLKNGTWSKDARRSRGQSAGWRVMGVVASVVVLCESEERAHPRQLLSPRLFMLDWPPPSVPPPSIGRLVQKRARGPERHPGLCLSTLHDGARRACFVASSPEQDRQTGGQIGNDGDFGAGGRGARSAKHDE